MISKKELLQGPDYLLSTYQLEMYRQLALYMQANHLSKEEVAEKLGVSKTYVGQILNGNFNSTLERLIELGLMMGKVPLLTFVEPTEYWEQIRQDVLKEKESATSEQPETVSVVAEREVSYTKEK